MPSMYAGRVTDYLCARQVVKVLMNMNTMRSVLSYVDLGCKKLYNTLAI